MKLNILQQDLLPALQSVSRSCGVRSTLPVLANILIQAQDKKLKLTATNLEVGIVKEINADIVDGGEITVPARTLLEVVSSLPNSKIDLETQGEQLKITADKFNATLNTIPASEFPPIPLTDDKGVEIDAKLLVGILPQISFAAATDEGRPTLTGILTEVKKDSLELVATDGFRLAHQTSKISTNGAGFKALIPRKTLEEVVRLISEEGELEKIDIKVSENQNQMIFKLGKTIVSSRLIEGNFPSWDKIIPKETVNRVMIERVDLLKAVKLGAVFAKDSANIIKIQTQEKGLKLTSEAKELGGQETEVGAEVSGEEIFIAFNAKYLIDALSNSIASQIVIEFSGNLSPCLIKPMGQEGLEYVVMPVRVS